jgi:hypothetical protein
LHVVLTPDNLIAMNSRHRKTLAALFEEPVPATLEWRRIEALFLALGAEMAEGGGSRVAFVLNGRRADFHRPHPGKEAKRYQVRAAREFLESSGVTL